MNFPRTRFQLNDRTFYQEKCLAKVSLLPWEPLPAQFPPPTLESVSLAEEQGWGPRKGQRGSSGMHLAEFQTVSCRSGAEGVRGAPCVVGGEVVCFSSLLSSSLSQETMAPWMGCWQRHGAHQH